ncbi:MAG: hypothetical protein WDN06_09080 [Asticcacaulis sp.]
MAKVRCGLASAFFCSFCARVSLAPTLSKRISRRGREEQGDSQSCIEQAVIENDAGEGRQAGIAVVRGQ